MSALLKHTRGKVVKHKARFIMREQLHVISLRLAFYTDSCIRVLYKLNTQREGGRSLHLCVLALEVSMAVRECCDLGWAHEREVQRVEEENDVLALHACRLSEFSVGASCVKALRRHSQSLIRERAGRV